MEPEYLIDEVARKARHCEPDRAHHDIAINAAGKDAAQLQYSAFNPRVAMFKTALKIVAKAAKPSAPHASRDAVETGGVNECFTGLGLGASLQSSAPRECLA